MKAPQKMLLLAALTACAAGGARAQVEPALMPPAVPASRPIPQPVSTIDEALEKARVYYKAAPFAERISMRVGYTDGRERLTTITLRADAGPGPSSLQKTPNPQEAPRQRRVYLDLEKIIFSADGENFAAISPQEPSLVYKSSMQGGLNTVTLAGKAPPVPVPQLEWTLGEAGSTTSLSATMLRVSWLRCRFTKSLDVIFEGQSPDGPASISFTNEGRLLYLSMPWGKDAVLEQAVAPDDAAGPWSVPTEGRTQVASVAELRTKPAEVAPGTRLPVLSLHDREFAPWPLQAALSQKSPAEVGPNRKTFGLLTIYRPSMASAQLDAEAGGRAVAMVRSGVGQEFPEAEYRPRLVGVVVGCVELPQFKREELQVIDQRWTSKSLNMPERVFSPTGNAILERLAKGSSAAMVVIDEDQKVLAIINLDGRAADDTGIAREALKAIVDTVRVP